MKACFNFLDAIVTVNSFVDSVWNPFVPKEPTSKRVEKGTDRAPMKKAPILHIEYIDQYEENCLGGRLHFLFKVP